MTDTFAQSTAAEQPIGIRAVIAANIEFSPSRKNLMVARLKAQAALMQGAKRDRTNPFAKNTYATLEAVLHAVAEPMCDAGLVLTQWVGQIAQDGKDKAVVTVYTRLEHAETSEYMQVSLPIPLTKHDAQGVGSAMTYGRRYTLKAALGIPEIDDDGAAASGQESELRPKKRTSYAAKKDGGGEKFNEIERAIDDAISPEMLRHVGETYRDDIAELPDGWPEHLRDRYEAKMDALRAKQS